MQRRLLALLATAALTLAMGCGRGTDDTERIVAQLDEISRQLRSIEDTQQKLVAAQAATARVPRPAEDYARIYDIPVGSSPVSGDEGARVTLVEYSDFQCPFCARSKELLRALAAKYPKDVKFVFKHYPLPMHAAARPLAIASMAAQEQGRFWEFHDVLFRNHQTLSASDEAIERYAREAGLDLDRFRKARREHADEYARRLGADMDLAKKLDVRGTPTLFINGQKVQNRSITGMAALIDAALAR